jgi:peptide-methionine (S)-S-oxide reductase
MPSWSRQYMSAVFYHDEEQKDLASKTKEHQAAEQNRQIFTEIIPFSEFYAAEDYHQKYALQHDAAIMKEFEAMYPSFDRIVSSTAAARVNGYLSGCGSKETLREEIDGYGLSRSSCTRLLNTIESGCRIQCAK